MPQPVRDARAFEPWQDPAAKPFLEIRNLTKAFGATYAVDDVSMSVYRGEFFSLLGPSGCGKSTLLRVLAGLERPDAGRVLIDGVDMTGVPPHARPVNMMFQSYALFPHMSVESNVAYGLRQARMPRAQIRERVRELLALVQLEALARRRPDQLSGGQRQRVALARALARQPKLLLLDEPLGALDRKLREHTRFELMNIQERVGITFIMVTHDQDEAMTMSTRMAVMESGRILQAGTPATVYEYPASRYVAEFIGSANVFEGKVVNHAGGRLVVRSAEAGCDLLMDHAQPLAVGTPVAVAVRPEKLELSRETDEHASHNRVNGTVAEVGYLGDVSVYHVRLASGKVVQVQLTNLARLTEAPLTWDDPVTLRWDTEAGVVLAQ